MAVHRMISGLFNSYTNITFREGTTPDAWLHIVLLYALRTFLKHDITVMFQKIG
jgi:hypothetical protein